MRKLILGFVIMVLLTGVANAGIRTQFNFTRTATYHHGRETIQTTVWQIRFINESRQTVNIMDNYAMVLEARNGQRVQADPINEIIANPIIREIEKQRGIHHQSLWVGDLFPGGVKTRIIVFPYVPQEIVKITFYGIGLAGDMNRQLVKVLELKDGGFVETSSRWENRR